MATELENLENTLENFYRQYANGGVSEWNQLKRYIGLKTAEAGGSGAISYFSKQYRPDLLNPDDQIFDEAVALDVGMYMVVWNFGGYVAGGATNSIITRIFENDGSLPTIQDSTSFNDFEGVTSKQSILNVAITTAKTVTFSAQNKQTQSVYQNATMNILKISDDPTYNT